VMFGLDGHIILLDFNVSIDKVKGKGLGMYDLAGSPHCK
jgi:hypothetical protein